VSAGFRVSLTDENRATGPELIKGSRILRQHKFILRSPRLLAEGRLSRNERSSIVRADQTANFLTQAR